MKSTKVKRTEKTVSELDKLPRTLQRIILKIREEQETWESDNTPGDNHYDGYSFN